MIPFSNQALPAGGQVEIQNPKFLETFKIVYARIR